MSKPYETLWNKIKGRYSWSFLYWKFAVRHFDYHNMESSNAPNAGIGKEEAPKLQIYPTPNTGVSPFWRGKMSSPSLNTRSLAQFTSLQLLFLSMLSRQVWKRSQKVLGLVLQAPSRQSELYILMVFCPIYWVWLRGIFVQFFKDRHYLDKEWGRYFSVS